MLTGGAKQGLVAIEEERYSTSDAKDCSCAAHTQLKQIRSECHET